MTNDDLCYLTANEALKLFRARKVSPVELLKAQIARSEKVNPAINCFTDRYFDEALDAGQGGGSGLCQKVGHAAAARRRAARGQGCAARQGQAHDAWLAHLHGPYRRSFRSDDRAAARGRRHHPCAHDDARILPVGRLPFARLGHDAQSVESRLWAGRLIGRIGRGTGRGAHARSRPAPISADRSAFRHRPAASSASSRRMGAIPMGRPPISTATIIAGR